MKRLSIRLRLTVLWAGLFLVAGAVLLGVTYLLVKQSISEPVKTGVTMSSPKDTALSGNAKSTSAKSFVQLSDGRQVTVEEASRLIRQKQEQFRSDTLNSLLTRGGVALGVVGMIAGGFGWLVAEQALRPVHDITATARRVAAGASTRRGLHERIALAGPRDEVKELADTFDDMLERLDRSFNAQRRFVADASHELRTPLAINRALIEVAITRPEASPDARQLGETLLSVNARNERLIDGLLTLAESENEVVEKSTVDLHDVAHHVLDEATPGQVSVRDVSMRSAPVLGDPVLLERLVHNLVENAVRHNHPGGWLSVSTATEGGSATLTVTNTGPVVASYDIERIFEPFRRLAGDRVASERGFGLGLSIARAVARAHGGDIAAEPRPGGGLVVIARLPAGRARPT
jgi:signal transduction histidine kinase